MDTIFSTSQFRRSGSATIKGEIMKKEMILETNDEAVDLSRRSMMGRFGLMASLACAAPVLMTMSTSAQANHKKLSKDQACKDGEKRNETAEGKVCGDAGEGEWVTPDTTPATNTSGW